VNFVGILDQKLQEVPAMTSSNPTTWILFTSDDLNSDVLLQGEQELHGGHEELLTHTDNKGHKISLSIT